MAEFKIVISDSKTGKSKQVQLSEENSRALFSKKIKENIKGEMIDMPGYEFQITGGSDHAGFPMRSDVPGTGRKRILSGKSIGIKKLKNKYDRLRKTVCGNTIHENTMQINMKIIKAGKQSLFEESTGQAEAEPEAKEDKKAEEKKEEKKAEAPKEDKKPEEKPETKKEDKKAEEKKEEKKAEAPKEDKKAEEKKSDDDKSDDKKPEEKKE